jgi:hypothetical protein
METAQLRYNWTDPDVYEAFMGRWSEHLATNFSPLSMSLPAVTCSM